MIAAVAANHFAGLNTGSGSSAAASNFGIASDANRNPPFAAETNLAVAPKSRRKSASAKNSAKSVDQLANEYKYLPFEGISVAHCDLCPLQFRNSRDLLAHYKEKHADRSDSFCEKCIRTIPEKNVEIHKNLHQMPFIRDLIKNTQPQIRDVAPKGPRVPKADKNRR